MQRRCRNSKSNSERQSHKQSTINWKVFQWKGRTGDCWNMKLSYHQWKAKSEKKFWFTSCKNQVLVRSNSRPKEQQAQVKWSKTVVGSWLSFTSDSVAVIYFSSNANGLLKKTKNSETRIHWQFVELAATEVSGQRQDHLLQLCWQVHDWWQWDDSWVRLEVWWDKCVHCQSWWLMWWQDLYNLLVCDDKSPQPSQYKMCNAFQTWLFHSMYCVIES